MAFLNCPVQSIEATLISQANISSMLDKGLHSSHMTFFGGQMEGCGLQFICWVDFSFCWYQFLDDPSMPVSCSTI